MDYFRQRSRQMLIGFCIGAIFGALQPTFMGVQKAALPYRCLLAFEIGAAFAVLALFLTNYLELRRRIMQRYSEGDSDSAKSD